MPKLTEVLSRAGVAQLEGFVSRSTVDLIQRMGGSAASPEGLASLIVAQLGVGEVLRRASSRRLILDALLTEEATELCELLELPAASASASLRMVPFDQSRNQLELLFSWFKETLDAGTPGTEAETRRAVASHRLHNHQWEAYREIRRRLEGHGGDALLRMPVAAGKLRIAATAIVDVYRSAPQDSVVLWLAHDSLMCGEATDELDAAWKALGSRDVVLHRHYGAIQGHRIDSARDGIVVADVRRLADAEAGVLAELGRRTRVVVVSEAFLSGVGSYRRVLDSLGRTSGFGLLGLSAASASLCRTADSETLVSALFPSPPILMREPDPLGFLQRTDHLRPLTFGRETGFETPLALDVGETDLNATAIAALEDCAERNVRVLARVLEEVSCGGRVALFAASSEQARNYLGVLRFMGTHAEAATSDMPRDAQIHAVHRFESREPAMVLCVHDVPVTWDMAPKINVAIVARPTVSPMFFAAMIGRLAPGHAGTPLKVVTVIDALPGFREIVDAFEAWDDVREEDTRP